MDCRNDGGKRRRKTTRIEFSQCIHPASFSKSLPEQIRLLFFARHIGAEAQVKTAGEEGRGGEVSRRRLGSVQEIILSRSSEVGPGARDAAIKSTTNCFRAANFAAVKLPSCINHPALPSTLFRNSGCNLLYIGRSLSPLTPRELERCCSFPPQFMNLTIS